MSGEVGGGEGGRRRWKEKEKEDKGGEKESGVSQIYRAIRNANMANIVAILTHRGTRGHSTGSAQFKPDGGMKPTTFVNFCGLFAQL